MAKFCERLRFLRTSHDLSQQEFAKLLKISKSSINMYERGEREPGIETLEAIADYFNVDMDYLIGKSDFPNKHAWLESVSEQDRPSTAGAHKVSREDVMFALFRGRENITDDMYEEVLSFADYIAQREAAKKSKKE